LNLAIIGCGLIGNKRATSLPAGHALVAVADTNIDRAKALALTAPGCVATEDWRVAIARADAVIVSTINNMLAPVAQACAELGKHVLVEKPAGRTSTEVQAARDAANRSGAIVKVGFNHRFHPAFVKAREIWASGECGPLMYIRARYGQGGRKGMETEWRGQRDLAGGGEMLDQGVHLIDLARWFAGDFVDVAGHVARYFWDWQVEDNGFALLKNASGATAFLHASCTEWKNLFSFEIFCRDAKLQIDGLGGSYGVEKLTYYKMLPQMGPPQTTSWEWPFPDDSWRLEMQYFLSCVEQQQQPEGNLDDAIAALKVVEKLYALSPPIV